MYTRLLKFIRKPKYYSLLLAKKTKTGFHNIFEPLVPAAPTGNIEDFKIFLWQQFMKNLTFDDNGCYYRTKVTNKNAPMTLSQARSILILCNNPKLIEPKFRSTFLIKKMTDYLISMRDHEGLFKFNQAAWDLQDEGIASVWATMALIRSYEATKEQKYIDAAKLTMDAMMTLLYKKNTSLVHTAGDHFWTLDAASTFAYVCSLLLKHIYLEDVSKAMNDSIELCIEKISANGHFPYHQTRDTYLLLYHPIVMKTLEYCLSSKYIREQTKQQLEKELINAKDFLVNCIDENNQIFEPEIKRYGQYIISNVTALYALKGKIEFQKEVALLNNIATYLQNGELYICKDNQNRLYNSDTYQIRDVFLIEVLFWLDLYFNE